ncbi:ABC transporter substrate-binding protein [Thermogymnomonas acidicola]|uniref:1,4-dihydroxy-6-naphtoate synthase n=1 Tax=Thermogymnomonas acidicola TaxID=399579 RepID=A0AA37BQC5_9ARCH|nr:MqnA/MqnD/SBP family protein [Thermogymnomonas acidicola]GGM69773.1 ABC transporter substrate-binding protein [Thermogymnomonas acidicola]
MEIVVAHTPDPDDSFMFYAMFEGKISTRNTYRQVVKDIETLNREAPSGTYGVTAISANGYAYASDKYALTPSGASFGISYGPMVVARRDIDLSSAVLATPGRYTSSHLLYQMFGPKPAKMVEMRFDLIPEAVQNGKVDAGILIHDEQLTFQRRGLVKVLDLYEEWKQYAGELPIPLGFNAIRKDLGKEAIDGFKADFQASIVYGKEHEDDALKYSLRYARYSDIELERKFVRMYVNELTVDFGERGRRALRMYYDRAISMGLLPDFDLEIV